MKYLLALATVGYAAETGSITALDAAGRVIKTEEFEFEAGEVFGAKLNLKNSPVPVDTVVFTTASYGIEECDIILDSGYKSMIAENVSMCDFPYHTFGSAFTGKLGLHNDQISEIMFKCLANDVTVKKYSECSAASDDTIDSNDARRMFEEFVS